MHGEEPRPKFEVESTDLSTVVSCRATCKDDLYGFANERLIGPLTHICVDIRAGSPMRTGIVPFVGDEDADPFLQVDVILESAAFDAIFKHFWISPAPSTIRVALTVSCYQHRAADMAGYQYGEDVVLEGKIRTAQLNDVAVEKRTTVPKSPDTEDDDTLAGKTPEDSVATWLAALQKHASDLAASMKRMELIAGIAVGALILEGSV
jgi:hypothetical protein